MDIAQLSGVAASSGMDAISISILGKALETAAVEGSNTVEMLMSAASSVAPPPAAANEIGGLMDFFA
ncbi:hypothetical protein FACS189499_03200 [Clostridia bacterium]|nr:hypothetical protein FACS189499_03200 [Clostridia bacterium]